MPDGRPFCPNCRAPQIRMTATIPQPPAPIVPEIETHLPDSPLSGNTLPPATERPPSSAIIKAGVIGVFLGMIPLLGSVLTGMLAVWLHRRAGGQPTARPAARMGAYAAALALCISAFLTIIQVFVFHARQQSEEAMVKLMTALGANLSDPELQASIHRLFTPSGMIMSFIFGLLFTLVLGAFGGYIASISRPRPHL